MFGGSFDPHDWSTLIEIVNLKPKVWAESRGKMTWLFPTRYKPNCRDYCATLKPADIAILSKSPVAKANMLNVFGKVQRIAQNDLRWVNDTNDWRNFLWSRAIDSLRLFGLENVAFKFCAYILEAIKNCPPSKRNEIWIKKYSELSSKLNIPQSNIPGAAF